MEITWGGVLLGGAGEAKDEGADAPERQRAAKDSCDMGKNMNTQREGLRFEVGADAQGGGD